MNSRFTLSLTILFFTLVLIVNNNFAQTTIYGGPVSGNWTKANSPYIIDGEIIVLDGNTLNIAPGVKVQFNDNYRLTVVGNLLAEGSTSDSIEFTVSDTTGYYENNHSGWHGIRFFETENEIDSSKIAFCIFRYGKTDGYDDGGYGGAVLAKSRTKLTIKNSLFENNYALSGGAIACLDSANINIEKNIIRNNEIYYAGGGIYSSQSNIVLENNYIANNESQNQYNGSGGGIYFNQSKAKISNTIIINNNCRDGAAIKAYSCDQIIVNNSTIAGNYSNSSSLELNYTNIIFNNTIIYNNNGYNEVEEPYYGSVKLNYCILENPLFEDLEAGDVNLKWYNYPESIKSPCIDAGDPFSAHDPDGTIRDIGAKYFHQTSEAPPKAYFSESDTLGLAPFTITFNDLSTQAFGNIVSWHWDFGDESSSTEQNPQHVFSEDGEFTVKLIVTNQDGKTDSIIKQNLITSIKGKIIDSSTVSGVWLKENSPYNIYNDITVLNGKTLTIEPGVEIKFYGNYSLNVQGSLLAIGTSTDSIHFTCNKDGNEWHSIRFDNTPTSNDSSKLNYCIIENTKYLGGNVTTNGGNALFVKNFNKLSITNSNLKNNYGGRGAGIYCDNANISIVNNTIENNSTNQYGAGIYVYYCSPLISNNTIQYNSASDNGGGIFCDNSSSEIINNIIINNSTYNNGGGVSLSNSDATIVNNLIANNTASYDGGGVSIYNCDPTIINSTLCFNKANSGWGVYINGSSTTQFYNSIIYSNKSRYSNYSTIKEIEIDSYNANPDFYNCNIHGGIENIHEEYGSYNGFYENIITSNPMFNDTINEDYSLSIYSPCLNSGRTSINNFIIPEFDLNNNPRIIADSIDIGSYEYQSVFTNRKPIIETSNDLFMQVIDNKSINVNVFDADLNDTHTFEVNSDNVNVIANNIVSHNSGFSFALSTTGNWKGEAKISIIVSDNSGTDNAVAKDSLNVFVDNYFSGIISSDTTWADTILVNKDVTIADDVTLNINPGTRILFYETCKMNVLGTIKALGNKTDSIFFTAKDTNTGWSGIRYDNYNGNMQDNDSSIFSYCSFSFTKNLNDDYQDNGVFSIRHYSNITVNNSLFRNNIAKLQPVIYCYSSNINVTNNTILNNISTGSSLVLFISSDGVFNNNLLYNNSINNIYSYYDLAIVGFNYFNGQFCNNTIVKNVLNGGSTIYSRYGNPIIQNNIIYFNSDDYYRSIYLGYNSNPIIKNNIIESGNALPSNWKSLTVDPDFVGFENNNFQLNPSSYAINLGNIDTTLLQIPNIDIVGNERIIESRIDAGAFEFQSTSENKTPIVEAIKDQFCKISGKKTVEINFTDLDNDSVFYATISSDNMAVISENISISNGKLVFDLVPNALWSDTANIVLSIMDEDSVINSLNTISFNFIVKNTIEVYGSYKGSITWDVDTVFVSYNTQIEENSKLTIEPGTVVAFKGAYNLKIYGSVEAKGIENDSIHFVRINLDGSNFYGVDNLLLINNTKDSSSFEYCTFKNGFSENSSTMAKVTLDYYKHATFSNCSFIGLFQENIRAIDANESNVEMHQCEFINNGNEYCNGGALYFYYGDIKISNCLFDKNKANKGGAIYSYRNKTDIINTIFSNNEATNYGGAIYNYYSNNSIINSSIVKNKALSGSALYNNYSNSSDTSCIINTIVYYNQNNDETPIFSRQNLKVQHSVIEGGLGSIETYNASINSLLVFNIAPYFTNAEENNFTLSDSSVCINSGKSDSILFTLIPNTDIANNPRYFESGNIDIGAYEFQASIPNKKPIIRGIENIKAPINQPTNLTIEVLNLDKQDSISTEVTCTNNNISITKISQSISGLSTFFEYTITPSNNWEGETTIQITANDNSGASNAISTQNVPLMVSKFACGEIPEDITWSGKIMVNCDIYIPDSVSLSIEAGSIIEFQGPYSIEVEGCIKAIGTNNDSILFTAVDTAEGWRGLQLVDNNYSYMPVIDTAIFKYCKFEFSKALGSSNNERNGGVIYAYQCDKKIVIENCQFINNLADYNGAAIYTDGTNTTINNNLFINNQSNAYRAAVYLKYHYGTLFNNIFASNYKAIDLYNSTTSIVNSTFKNNRTHLTIDYSNMNLTNCIFWNDTTPSGIIRIENYYDDTVIFNTCALKGGESKIITSDSYQIINPVNYNPQFVSQSYKLSSGSPLINLGNPAFDSLNLFDITGNPRIYEETNQKVDIGAHEFQGSATNRKPIIKQLEVQRTTVSTSIDIPIFFIDFDKEDTHTIKVESYSNNVTIGEVNSDTSGAIVNILPNAGWFGSENISIIVTDNSNESNASDTSNFILIASNEVCGTISGNTTWDFPFIKVICDVVVDSNATLTITPGTYVEFQGTNKLTVYGNLKAQGTAADSITFSVPYADRSTGWRGIQIFGNGSDSSIMDYCIVNYYHNSSNYPELSYGAININNNHRVRISNSHIHNNTGEEGSGSIKCQNANIIIDNNKINNNQFSGVSCSNSNALISKNQISKNTSSGYYGSGAGIACVFKSKPIIKNNIIQYNKSYNNGGAISCSGYSSPTIVSNIISYNSADEGGGIYIKDDTTNTQIINNLISKNSPDGISFYSTNSILINNTITDNLNKAIEIESSNIDVNNNIISKSTNNSVNIKYPEDETFLNFTNCLIEGGASQIGYSYYNLWDENDERLINCIYDSLEFQDASCNNYGLDFNSPAYNKGTIDTTGLLLPSYDLKGVDRIIGDTVDIGAFEFNNTIDNRIPKIVSIPHYAIRQNDSLIIQLLYSDVDTNDTHTINITSNKPGVIISALSGQTSGSTFHVIPESDFTGEATINIEVSDDSESNNATASTEFKVIVGDTYYVHENYLDHDFVWNTDKVKVYNYLQLQSNKILNIHAGTTVEFQSFAKLDIKGQLFANGTENDSILFTIAPNNNELKWEGIYFEYNLHQSNDHSPDNISELSFCKIEDAKKGLYLKHLHDIKVTNCEITNNELGIFIEGGATIEQCKIHHNNNTYNGGGINVNGYGFVARIYNNEIYSNTSGYKGGGLYAQRDCILLGNLIHHNTSSEGGGVYINESHLINNTIANNTSSNKGGGVYLGDYENILINNIIQHNYSLDEFPEIYFDYSGSGNVLYNNYISGGLDSVIETYYSFNAEFDNIYDTNSDFVDTTNNNYNLVENSICINSGLMNPELMFSLDSLAIDKLNIIDRIDIGAIEFVGEPTNRLPIITRKDGFYIRKDSTKTLNVSYSEFDLNDNITASIVFEDANLSYSVVSIEEDYITFDITPNINWSGNTLVTITLLDTSNIIGETNQKTFDLSVSNTYNICGEINENMTWDADTILINCNTSLHHNAELNILPGTKVLFQGDYSLNIDGIINAIGNEADSIIFTRTDSTWCGILINPIPEYSILKDKKSTLSYCIIENTNPPNYRLEAAITLNRSNIALTNSKICNNQNGGVRTGGNVLIKDNIISKNNIGIKIYGKPIIQNNIIEKNYPTSGNLNSLNDGSGIICYYGSDALITNNNIRYNQGTGIRSGNFGSSSPKIINNFIHNNKPFGYSGGGGIYIYQQTKGTHITGNVIYNNHSSEDGGGIAIGYEYIYEYNYIINNTIVNNSTDQQGGGIYLFHGYYEKIHNNIIWGNMANGSKNQISANYGSNHHNFHHNLVEEGIEGIGFGLDSIVALYSFEPNFIDATQGLFGLQGNSEAINKGYMDTTEFNLPIYDISNNPRVYNDTIDLGAFEYNNCTSSDTSLMANICSGESLVVGTSHFDESGEYSIFLYTESGCDSIVNLSLTVLSADSMEFENTICEGEDFMGYNETGIYFENYTNTNGCDSILVIDLTVLPMDSIFELVEICEGDEFMGHSESGTFYETYSNNAGCDSIVEYHLTVNLVDSMTIEKSICEGEEYLGYNETGIYFENYTNTNGCDSILVIDLSVEPLPVADFSFSAIENEVYFTNLSANADSYYWDFGDSTNNMDINPIKVYQNDGLYNVNLTAFNDLCGESSNSQEVNIATSIDSHSFESLFDIYPNPSNGLFTLEVKSKMNNDVSIRIIDITGLVIYNKQSIKRIEQIDLSNYAQGTYIMEIKNNKQIIREAIIIH